MRKNPIWLAFLVLGLVLAGNAWAQLPTATLSGKVINEGQGLPGVSVAVKSPNLQGTRSTVTSGNGDYTFVALPPGRYTVTYSLSGFQPVTKQIDLASNQASTLNATLSLTAITAEATVVGHAEQISETTQASTTVTVETVNKLPVGRNIASMATLGAGVASTGASGNLVISGAASFENAYLVNGANIQDNVRNTPQALFIEDSIQEVTTTVGGVSAEYGRFGGGIVNTITKSGGNTFSGSLRDSLRNPAWSAVQPYGKAPDSKTNPTYEATLGGPFWKDRIWFFLAGRYAKTGTPYTNATSEAWTIDSTDKRYEAKLTISPLQNHTLTGSYMKLDSAESNYHFTGGAPPLERYSGGPGGPDLLYSRTTPQDRTVINYNGVLTSNFFLEGQYSNKKLAFENSGGSDTTLAGGTVIADPVYGSYWNSAVFCATCPGATETRDNNQYFGKATYFLSTPSIGSHNVVVGYDEFHGKRHQNNWQDGSGYFVYSDDTTILGNRAYPVFDPGAAFFTYYPIFNIASPNTSSDLRTQSVFLNDAWKLNNMLSFNLGVRYDKNKGVDQSGTTRQSDSAWSPRLGASFDPKGDGHSRINASYSRYVSQMQETYATAASGTGALSYYYYLYGGDPINDGSTPYLNSRDAVLKFLGWWGIDKPMMGVPLNADTFFGGATAGVNQRMAPGLTSAHNDEFVLGTSGTVGSNLTYRVDATYRNYKDFLEIGTTPNDTIYDPLALQTLDWKTTQNGGSQYLKKYFGLAASFAWKPTSAVSLSGNWTWSHTYGNFSGENPGSGPVFGGLSSYKEYFDLNWYAPTGNLPQDQRHRVRLLGTFDAPLPKAFGFLSLGAVFQANSGSPYSAVGTVTASMNPNINGGKDPGYASPPATVGYYFSGRGAYTSEAWYETDLSLNYSYKIGPVEIFVIPQIINVFNSQHASYSYRGTQVNQTVYTSLNTGKGLSTFDQWSGTAPIECPQGQNATQCKALGANWQKGANFGKAISASAYQQGRTFQISAGLRF